MDELKFQTLEGYLGVNYSASFTYGGKEKNTPYSNASEHVGISYQQLRRLCNDGAMVDSKGDIWRKSACKLKDFKGLV